MVLYTAEAVQTIESEVTYTLSDVMCRRMSVLLIVSVLLMLAFGGGSFIGSDCEGISYLGINDFISLFPFGYTKAALPFKGTPAFDFIEGLSFNAPPRNADGVLLAQEVGAVGEYSTFIETAFRFLRLVSILSAVFIFIGRIITWRQSKDGEKRNGSAMVAMKL